MMRSRVQFDLERKIPLSWIGDSVVMKGDNVIRKDFFGEEMNSDLNESTLSWLSLLNSRGKSIQSL